MLKNGKFSAYAAALGVVCVGYGFLCAGLLGGHTAFLRAFAGGWAAGLDDMLLAAALFCVPAAFICGAAITRFGIRGPLIFCAGLSALGCVGIAAADGLDIHGGAGSYALLCASVTAARCAGAGIMLCTGTLCVRWFVRGRGPALAIISLGVPLFFLLRPALSAFAAGRMGGDCRVLYLGAAAALAVLAALTRVVLADWPEEAGLYPDGAGEAPDVAPEELSRMTAGEAMRRRGAWLSVGCCAGLAFAAGTGGSVWITAAALYLISAALPYASAAVYGRRDCAAGLGDVTALGLIPAVIAAYLTCRFTGGGAGSIAVIAAVLGIACLLALRRGTDREDKA